MPSTLALHGAGLIAASLALCATSSLPSRSAAASLLPEAELGAYDTETYYSDAQWSRRYSPTFDASALTSHDPAKGWSVNPNNMPIGNGRLVALVWADGHEKTSGVGILLARDDAYTELVQLVKLGRVRIQLEPDPFANASSFTQRLDLETGEVLLNSTSADGALSVALRLSVDPQADALVVELLSTTKPVKMSAALELWREERPWRTYNESGCQHEPCKQWSEAAGMLHGICGAENYTQHADTVLDLTAENRLAWFYRNRDAHVWETTLRRQDTADVLDELPDPLLNRTFGGLVAGDNSDGTSWISSSPLRVATGQAVSAGRLAIMTHTAQTRTVSEWAKGIEATLASTSPASAKRVAAAHAERRATMKEFWGRSYVTVGEMAPPPPVPSSFFIANSTVANVTNSTILVAAFVCTTPDSCASEAATACLAKGAACQSFAVAQDWKGPNGQSKNGVPIEAQLYTSTFQSCSSTDCPKQPWGSRGTAFSGSTLWVKRGNSSVSSSPAPPPLAAPFLLNQNYLLFRYQQLIQGNGSTAIHFNGGIIDWGATGDNSQPKNVPDHGNPDYRAWGSGFWFQNVRMAYYPNLADGDSDQLLGLFRHYRRTMPLLRSRAKNWFGTDKGSMFFAETSWFWGSYLPDNFGCDQWNETNRMHQSYGPRGKPDVTNKFMWHHIEGGIELAGLMVRHWHFTADTSVLQKYTLPWCDGMLQWYDQHYPKLPNGTMLLLNAKSCETYLKCTNPAPQVAGLHMVLDGLLQLPTELLGASRLDFYTSVRNGLPSMPLMASASNNPAAPASAVQIAPCLINVTTVTDAHHARGGYPIKADRVNGEAVETYPIWPYEVVSARNDSVIGENTQTYRIDGGSNTAWDYNAGLVPAILGGQMNAQTAFAATLQRLMPTIDQSQYPGYSTAGTGCADGCPQMENQGIVRTTLQKMLLSTDNPGHGNAIYLLPTWPQARDVSFKLHAPQQTIVEVEYKAGKIRRLVVTPVARKNDVVLPSFLASKLPASVNVLDPHRSE